MGIKAAVERGEEGLRELDEPDWLQRIVTHGQYGLDRRAIYGWLY